MECPKCQQDVSEESNFCYKCGHNFNATSEIPSKSYNNPECYTPKHLGDKILKLKSSIIGEKKLVTVLFADVANYTSMSEKLDPEEVHQIMDEAFNILMNEIHKYEGTINQFTGDGVMALFGAPVSHENHAQRACYSALSIQGAMHDFGEKLKKDYDFDFEMRIGLNSGLVIVGSIGDDLRMDYTAVGDTTNLAARMESQADPGSIFVSGNTYKIAEKYFDFNHIGKTEVKGKEEPQDIYELIKASDVVTRIDESAAKGLTPFVGRKNSMPTLMEVYDKVKDGSGQVAGIVGEAGVGKTRLILEMRNQLPENEYTYLEGQCLQYGGSILYKPILDILRTFFDIKDDDREIIIKKKISDKVSMYGNLDHALPAFQDLLSVKVDNETFLKLEPIQKRERIFEAIRDLLISVSREELLVMVVEDLHWIDDTSEDFLDYFIEWIANSPIMLILLYRTEYRHQWGSKTYYNRIGLEQLRKESSIELVKAMLTEGDVAPEIRDLILKRAAGNPLYMEELTHTLIENGSIKKEDSQYVFSRKIADIEVPDTVQGIISARMDRLEDNLKRTIQVASVIGRDFAFRILQTITGMREELKSYLQNLQGLEFIYEKNLFPELEYIFKHALTQEVAYNSLLVKRRKQIHENIGKAIEEIYSERLEEFYEMLAYHYSKSDNLEKAVQYLRMSGEKAFRNYANQEAYNFYIESINVLNRLPDTEENRREKIEISILMHSPMSILGFPKGSLEILQNGEKLSKEIGDKKSLASFYGNISLYYVHSGNPIEGVRYTESRFFNAQKDQDIELMAPLSYGLCNSYAASRDYYKVEEIVHEVIALLEKTKRESESFGTPLNIYSYLCSMYGQSLVFTGNLEKGRIFIEKAHDFAFESNNIFNLGVSQYHYGSYYIYKGDGKRAIEHFQKGIKYLEEGNWPWLIGLSWALSGYGYYLLGDLNTAKSQIEKGFNIHKNTAVAWLGSLYSLFLSNVHYDLGDLDKAQSYAEEALELSIKNDECGDEGRSKIWLGRILGKKDSLKSAFAENYILQGIRIIEELKLRPWLSQGYFILGEFYANCGRKKEALEYLKKALSMYQEMGIGYWPEKIQKALDRL